MDKKTAAREGSRNPTQQRHSTIPNQNQRILEVLQRGQSLTSYDMHQMGILGCNARICELRQAGHNIVCIMERTRNQFGQTVKRGRYWLMPEGRA